MHQNPCTYFSRREQQRVLLPVLRTLRKKYQSGKTVVVGIQGGQGTGKTTLAQCLEELLRVEGFHVTRFSLDDFYRSAAERRKLAKKYHHNPFYQIARGMPGTHRVRLLAHVLERLKAGKPVRLPIFDKSQRQGYGEVTTTTVPVRKRQDFIFFEGWCVGLPVVSTPELLHICHKNKIPLHEVDPTLQHHKLVLQYSKTYQHLWKYLDMMITLKPDHPALHHRWREQQEQELRQKTGRGMKSIQIQHFVDYYLPFTYICYEKLKSDIIIKVNAAHQFYSLRWH